MSAPIPPNLCVHKLNPVACWHCYQGRSQAAVMPNGQARRYPTGEPGMNDPINPLLKPPMPTRIVPAPRGPQAEAPRPEASRPKPITADAIARAAEIETVKRDSEVTQPWLPDANGVLQPPPKRPDIIERVAKRDDVP
jgi:hypothetical protein